MISNYLNLDKCAYFTSHSIWLLTSLNIPNKVIPAINTLSKQKNFEQNQIESISRRQIEPC